MTDDRPLADQGAHRALTRALLLERYGPPPTGERRAPARPRVPWTPDTPQRIAERRRLLALALDDIPIKHARVKHRKQVA